MAMAMALPLVPFTPLGGDRLPDHSVPQHTTAPVSAWIAQLRHLDTSMALAVPFVPLTSEGGAAVTSPQHTTAPVSVRIAQL